jgi:hypothetical protein
MNAITAFFIQPPKIGGSHPHLMTLDALVAGVIPWVPLTYLSARAGILGFCGRVSWGIAADRERLLSPRNPAFLP